MAVVASTNAPMSRVHSSLEGEPFNKVRFMI
jgi:hypothetical protein